VVSGWYNKLKPHGILRIATADFRAVCEWYLQSGSLDRLYGLIVGGQKDQYDRHGMVFDLETLTDGLTGIGFRDVWTYDWRATIVGILGIDDFSQTFMPHMDKENGKLMSLHVEAVK
jgi:predicted SAM-dependent methyltransferase